jgi:NADH-quinone oxidoreductase subunit J
VTAESFVFFFLAACAVTTAVLMVIQRNPVMSAILLIANFFCLAGLYLLLRAQLLAVLQIAVYAGAIMVLVVFVIMLLNLGDEEKLAERISLRATVGVILVAVLLLEILYIVTGGWPGGLLVHPAPAEDVGTVESMGMVLFTKFLFPLQLTGLLLLAAIIGAILLAKKKIA